jgi:hypothetical protein
MAIAAKNHGAPLVFSFFILRGTMPFLLCKEPSRHAITDYIHGVL